MPSDSKPRPSFSTGQRWRIGFDVVLRTALVLAVAAMANFLGGKFYQRFYLSPQTRVELSSRTLAVLRAMTNRVDVTLYFDKHDDRNFYPDIVGLLNLYAGKNPKISVRTVDYVRDAGEAGKVKEKYQQYFGSQSDKDLVIFDSGGRVKVFPGAALIQYKDKYVGMTPRTENPKQSQMEFQRRPVGFNGEQAFTSMLLALSSSQPLKAYFLQGHGEPSLAETATDGYQKFASVLGENYIGLTNLNWISDAGVPMDCNLLVIAGPKKALGETELKQISQYLHEGGRLLMLFDYKSQGHPTGLEPIMQNWGVTVGDDIVTDPEHSKSKGYDLVVNQFKNHPAVNSLSQVQLQLLLPRPIIAQPGQSANAPEVRELFGTSPDATLMVNRSEPPHQYPIAVAVEQKPVAGTIAPRGSTRIVVVGDSFLWDNQVIEAGGNRDFLNSAVNWLCDRPTLLEGIGPRPVTEFRLEITRRQQRQLQWLLLGALPGGVLFIGWLVWLVRRK
jgi:hypothetical protein